METRLYGNQASKSKRENFNIIPTVKELVAGRISNLKGHFKSPKCKVLDQPDVKDTIHKLHANYVLVPADKAANNLIIVCKKYCIDTLVKELGINNVNINNPTYIPIDDSFETIVKSHNQFITSVGLEISEEDKNLPYLYWTPKLHKSPYKHRFIHSPHEIISTAGEQQVSINQDKRYTNRILKASLFQFYFVIFKTLLIKNIPSRHFESVHLVINRPSKKTLTVKWSQLE